MKLYLSKNVLDAARERMALVFDEFEHIYVSVSGGKDSTVLFHLAVEQAAERGRKFNLFFLDQEMEYESTIGLMREMMKHPNVIPLWYQVPLRMTNATSYEQDMLHAWGPGEKWVRSKEDTSIHEIEGEYPQRFHPFFKWFEEQQPEGSAFLVGLRADESLNRFRAVTKHPSYNGIKWSSKASCGSSHKFYPLYDWGHGDVWKYIDDHGCSYNVIYDQMFANNHSIYNTMRVSNLIHEKSFTCLTYLQVLEPETYEKVIHRVEGTHCAALYAKEDMIYSNTHLPSAYLSWKEYRGYLLDTMPTTHRDRFIRRFKHQPDNEQACRQQCRALLLNDYENNLGISTKQKTSVDVITKWREIL